MGGVINVAIRLKDGRAFCQERWTNNMPFWFKDPKMFDGDEEHIMGYINAVAENDWIANPYAPGRPQPVENSEYGLIVWDFMTGTIIDNNHYSCPVEFDVVNTGTSGSGREVSEQFRALAQAGKIFRRTYHYPARDPDTTGRANRREGSIPYTDTFPLSYEDALRLGQEAFDKEFGPGYDEWRTRDRDAAFDHVVFMVNSDPLTYFWMGDHSEHYNEETEEEPLAPEYLAKLKEIGFPMTAEEGLNATLSYKVPEPRKISETEEVARELFQDSKEAVEEFKGVAFDDLSDQHRDFFLKQAADLASNPESLRQWRFQKLMGGATITTLATIGGDSAE